MVCFHSIGSFDGLHLLTIVGLDYVMNLVWNDIKNSGSTDRRDHSSLAQSQVLKGYLTLDLRPSLQQRTKNRRPSGEAPGCAQPHFQWGRWSVNWDKAFEFGIESSSKIYFTLYSNNSEIGSAEISLNSSKRMVPIVYNETRVGILHYKLLMSKPVEPMKGYLKHNKNV